MPRTTLYFTEPRAVEVRTDPLPNPGPYEVRVHTTYSAISPGTERLVYRGQVPNGEEDAALDRISADLEYPVAYGYSAVGVVDAVGPEVDARWKGRRVFAFQPHTSHFCCAPEQLIVLPDAVNDRDAVFLANMETAVNLVMDGRPMIGERVLVIGQGVVGLLTTALLSRFPLDALLTTDLHAPRRQASVEWGAADEALDPTDPSTDEKLREVLELDGRRRSDEAGGADVIFELSGMPDALNDALRYTGFESRIVIGSWYGQKRAPIDLGGTFHRRRIRITSSQVSTLASAHRGRWDKARRMDTALAMIEALRPAELITSTVPLDRAAEVYAKLDAAPTENVQIVFKHA